ncbi:MAG: hypothetical protein ACRCX5_05280 [Bacteroidales bacterium]
MNLTLYFRLICTVIFQDRITKNYKHQCFDEYLNYDNCYFICPRVFAKDGFSISLQINHTNYCESENGYRELGHTWKDVEFGSPSELDEILKDYAEDKDTNETVGKIPVEVLEKVFEKHGGVDWEKTISVESFERMVWIK